MLVRLRALVALLLLAACDPTEVGPELEAAIALAITGPALVPFSTATVTARGPVTIVGHRKAWRKGRDCRSAARNLRRPGTGIRPR